MTTITTTHHLVAAAATAALLTLTGACGSESSGGEQPVDKAPGAVAPKVQTQAHVPMSADSAERRFAEEAAQYDPAHPPVSADALERRYAPHQPTSADAAERRGDGAGRREAN